MYNRYIPQPDGTYLRNKIPDPTSMVKAIQMPPKEISESSCLDTELTKTSHIKNPQRAHSINKPENIPGFLRQLLPGNIDTGDLMIILLLLLIAGDCEDDRNNALLTLALYFFM